MLSNFKFYMVFLVSVAMVLTSCSEDSGTNNNAGTAQVLVAHTSPDAPGVDLLVDNKLAGTNLTFPANTGYLEVEEGTRNVKVNVTGTSTTVIEADLTLDKDTYYSVFAVDEVANLSPLVIVDDLTSPASGIAHVRFIHLSPDAPAVDITTTDGTIVFADYEFKEYTPFTPLPAGTYDLQVRLDGTSTVVLDLSGITLDAQKIYTVFAKGFVAGVDTQSLGAEIIINK
jgi:Domain of unknown function (DUF4397)